jgi:16S rRNA (guanine(1405)-N(7))-methyltransferase
MTQSQLDELVMQVRSSAKYAQVNADLVRRIGALELKKRRSLKAAIKETKNTLHQVAGMFAEEKASYGEWLKILVANAVALTRTPLPLGERLRKILSHHASTRERLPILETFYKTIFADLGPIHSVLDVACGLNPLAIPWMGLAPGATYHAVDIYDDMMAFLQQAMSTMGMRGTAESRDVVADCPSDDVDVALILKAIPCLEQLDKHAGQILLDTIRARHIVVSYPTRTVGGKNIGMVATYDARFNDLIANRDLRVKRFVFENELVFRISNSVTE